MVGSEKGYTNLLVGASELSEISPDYHPCRRMSEQCLSSSFRVSPRLNLCSCTVVKLEERLTVIAAMGS